MKRSTTAMIQEISDILEKMGNGDYNFEITQEYVGEYDQIKESFLKIKEKMRETLGTIREVSLQIDSGSEQMSCAAVDLAEGSQEQAGKISDLVSLMNDMYKWNTAPKRLRKQWKFPIGQVTYWRPAT